MSASVAKQAATVTKVTTGTTVVTLLAASANRSMVTIVNDATSGAALLVKFGANAGTDDYTVSIAVGGYYEMPIPVYGGIITGILSTGAGVARVTSW